MSQARRESPTSVMAQQTGYAGTQQGYTGPEQGYGQQAGGANPGAYAQTGTGQDYQSGYQAGYQAGYQVGYQAAYTAYASTSGGGVGAGGDVGGDVMAGAEDVLEASETMPMGAPHEVKDIPVEEGALD